MQEPEPLRAQWGVNIRVAREAKDLTQAKLGELCGVNQSTVAKWERGTISPTRGNMVKLGEILGCDAREMFPLELVATAAAEAG